jgi:hypothetical protein
MTLFLRQARKLATGLGMALAGVALCVPTAAQQRPSYQVIAPDIVPQGEEFNIRVVENAEVGRVPIRPGTEVVINGTVVSAEEGGKLRVPAFVKETGSQFLQVTVRNAAEKTQTAAPTQHVEIVRLPPTGQLPSSIWHVSGLFSSGGDIRVDGQALGGLRQSSLRGTNGAYPLTDSVGSSLQQIYRCPADLPKGPYHFVAQDASGRRVEAPNTSTNPTLTITGTQIRKRGQRGQFVVTSDVEGDVQLSGGEPIIQLDIRTVHVTPTKPGTVKFSALQVGDYHVEALMLLPDAPPPNAPRADARAGKLEFHFNPGEGKTSIDSPIKITNGQGQPIPNSAVDVALAGPQGIQYMRITTGKNGQGSFHASLPGQVSADALSLHCFRVLGHLWK